MSREGGREVEGEGEGGREGEEGGRGVERCTLECLLLGGH